MKHRFMDIFHAIRLISINKVIDFYRSTCFNNVFHLTSCCYFCFHYFSLRNGTVSIFGWSESKVLSDFENCFCLCFSFKLRFTRLKLWYLFEHFISLIVKLVNLSENSCNSVKTTYTVTVYIIGALYITHAKIP